MPPTLALSLLTEEDVPAFAAVDDAAMASWPYAQAMGVGLPGPRIEMVERWVRHGLLHDSTQTYLRVCDEGSGEMVAGALWRFAPAEEGAGGREEEEEEEEEGQSEGERKAKAFGRARREMWEAFRAGFFGGGEAYANLQILVTIPRYRRQGAASQLIEWGTKRADERGLKCVLMASEAGLGAYLKHGFKVVREVEMDLRPYGVDATELRRWMVREPRKAG